MHDGRCILLGSKHKIYYRAKIYQSGFTTRWIYYEAKIYIYEDLLPGYIGGFTKRRKNTLADLLLGENIPGRKNTYLPSNIDNDYNFYYKKYSNNTVYIPVKSS